MDKEQAQFILKSFRPDGADAEDPDFAPALALALEDRELGGWLAAERDFDSAFARALASIDTPENLRGNILQCLSSQRSDFPQAEDPWDATMIGAIASIQPPSHLREEILAAMDRTPAASSRASRPWKKIALPLAAAAGITLAIFLTRSTEPARIVLNNPLPLDVVQTGFIQAFESPSFTLEEARQDHQVLIRHLQSRKLPCPGCLPPGLTNVKGIGCCELVIDGKRGSLVCFDERQNGRVHLVIFRREDVACQLPPHGQPSFAKHGHWAAARWEDENKVFILIGKTEIDRLASLF